MEQKNTACQVSKAGTFDLVIDEIAKLSSDSPEGFTISEMATATGHHEQWCRAKLGALILYGKAECAGRRNVARMDGRRGNYTPVYRLVDNG